jgi:hypothetical protein
MIGRATEYRVKAGSRATLQLTITDSSGTAKSLTDTVTYASGSWKVWKPSGTLIINGAITYDDRVNGIIIYALTANDTLVANAGNWEGEVELKNSSGTMVEQTQTFNFTIEDSY